MYILCCLQVTAESVQKMSGKDIIVLGGGASGLISALRLQESFPGSQIVLCADHLGPEASSVYCPSLFLPLETLNWNLIGSSWEYFKQLVSTENHKDTGISEVPCYLLGHSNKFQHILGFLSQRGYVHRTCTLPELALFGSNGTWNQQGIYTHTFMIDPKIFLSWALNRFQQNGGQIRKLHIQSFDAIDPNQFGLVVNCTGLGARKLCQDSLVVPKTSKILKVNAPWIKMAVIVESQVLILPGMNDLILHSANKSARYPQNIWAQACRVIPKLRDASNQVQDTFFWRSSRIRPRLEFENIGPLRIIHNYGHGDSSIIFAPGFADAVVHMYWDYLKSSHQRMGKL